MLGWIAASTLIVRQCCGRDAYGLCDPTAQNGSEPTCDVVPWIRVNGNASTLFAAAVPPRTLPLNVTIFCAVEAKNRAGGATYGYSNGFAYGTAFSVGISGATTVWVHISHLLCIPMHRLFFVALRAW